MKILSYSWVLFFLTVGVAFGQDELTEVQEDIVLGLKTYRFPEDQRRGFQLRNTIEDLRHPVIQQLLLERFAQTQFDAAEEVAWDAEIQKMVQKSMDFIDEEAEIEARKLIKNDTPQFKVVFDSLKTILIKETIERKNTH
jgi:hypothetical protein